MTTLPRFTQWTDVGQVTVTPNSDQIAVGSFSMGADHDSIWVRITSLSATTPWPWSYGILSWKTTEGYELGSTKAYSATEGEVFRLGTGLQPVVRTGSITFEPRSFNLAWVKKGYPWSLKFQAQSGKSCGTSTTRVGAVVNSFVNTSNSGLSLVRVNFP